MYEKGIKKAKLISKISPIDTLKAFSIGEPFFIKTKEIKASSIRSAVRNLRKKGYEFDTTERGLINEVQVTRTK